MALFGNSKGACEHTAMPGIVVKLTWDHAKNASDIEVHIETKRRVLPSVLEGCLQTAASTHRKRVLVGNLPDLRTTIRRLHEKDPIAIMAILCHSRGHLEPDPCEACKTTDGNHFGGCFTLPGWFGNTCARCLFTGRDTSCSKTAARLGEVIDLTGHDGGPALEEVIDLTGHNKDD